jgi:excisionase family DNA binding protein
MQTEIVANTPTTFSADPDPWLTTRQAGDEIHVHEATIRRECKAGRLRHAKVGGRKSIRIRRSWLAAWLEASRTPVEVRR